MSREQAKMVAGPATHHEPQAGSASRLDGFHAARMERPRFRLDLRRSLRMHRRMALGIALLGIALAAAYLVRYWPVYSAETLVYIQPAPVVETSEGVAMRWPYNYDPATYESYVQQQMLSMTRADVLKSAAGMLRNFQKSGESEDDAAARLGRAIEVARVGNSYEVAIRAQAGTAQMAADMANAAAASYVENTVREQKAGDGERIALLREQADLVKKELDDDRAELNTPQAAAQPRSGYRSAEIERLQNRYDALDAQIQNLSIDVAASETAHVATKAVAPARPIADGVVRNAVIALAAFLLLSMLAAVLARKLDPRLYVAEDEPVRTRRVEVRAAPEATQTAAEQARMEWESASPKVETTVVAEPPVTRQTQRVQVPEMPVQPPSPARMRNETLPWWLADPILHPELRIEKPGAFDPESAPEEEAADEAPEAVSPAQESRLSGLRKLFANRNAVSAGDAPASASREKPAPVPEGRIPDAEQRKTGAAPERDRAFASGRAAKPQPSAADRRATPEITALPEFLPPGAVWEGKHDADAASRRERRDTWDDVAVLPSWRGQYRRKD